jgi:hypothetical protein
MLPSQEPARPAPGEDWAALKGALRRFEDLWRRGARPAIDDFLPAAGEPRRRLLVELAHVDLELRLKAGETARAEDYLARYPELAEDRPAALGLITAEHDLRRRVEPGLTIEEYRRRFPEFLAELPEHIPAETLVGGGRETPSPPPGPPRQSLPQVAGYEVLGQLGRGGMGVVYKARQKSLGRLVALKLLPEGCALDPAWLGRFRREARTASALNHPHICTIHDTGECGGRPFITMELIEGQTLAALAGRLPPAELARLGGQAARALAAAHAAGVVHRDVKPANLMVRGDGLVKVLDFGLAHRLPAEGAAGDSSAPLRTEPGARVGTLLYMSPEQARAQPVGTATDVFSLGVVLYELATGQHPFLADSEVDVLHAIAERAPLPPARLNPEVPAALDALVLRMLAKEAGLRPTAAEVAQALAALSEAGGAPAAGTPPASGTPPPGGRPRERPGGTRGLVRVGGGRPGAAGVRDGGARAGQDHPGRGLPRRSGRRRPAPRRRPRPLLRAAGGRGGLPALPGGAGRPAARRGRRRGGAGDEAGRPELVRPGGAAGGG